MLIIIIVIIPDCCKDMGQMSTRPLNTISVIDSSLARLCIAVKLVKIVVEVNISSTQMSTFGKII